jgi:Raf kinase inhibitor-like YbhB/YbcL family protein
MLVAACGGDHTQAPVDKTPVPSMTLQSEAFPPYGLIPEVYSCDGANISPPLSWSNAPAGTAAYVLLVTDPDAPRKTFDHWVVYDIRPEVSELPEGFSGSTEVADEAMEGKNDFGKIGYGGPCPPKGSGHRYVFRIYALSEPLALGERASREDVQKAMLGKVLARGELIGRFGR